MPPSIDADASSNGPPSPLPCPGHGGPTTTAFSSVEMESKEDENERNFAAADPTSLLTYIDFVSREVFRTQQLRAFQMMRVGWAMDLPTVEWNEVDVMCIKRKEDAGFIVFVGNVKSLLENRTCTCWMNQEHAPQETVAIMGQLQPMANEDETGSYERARESCTTRMECAKRRKHVLKFFCHTKASIYLSAGKVGMEVTWKGTIPLK